MAVVETNHQTPPSSDNTPAKEPTLDRVLKGFKNSRKYTESGFWDTWEDCWKLYNNQRVSIGYDGYTDTFIPETYTEIQGIKAHLINGNLEVEFMPTDPSQKGNVDVLQDAFNYAWYKDYMDQKLDSTITEYLVTGNCYIWSYPGEDGFPCQQVISAKDCFFDPMVRNYSDLNEWGYGGYRYITTLDALKEETIVNSEYDDTQSESEENAKKVPRFKNLDQVGTFNGDDDDSTAKEEREEMLADAALEDKEGQVEVIVYIKPSTMEQIVVANRTVVIEELTGDKFPFQRKAKTIQSADDQGNPVPMP